MKLVGATYDADEWILMPLNADKEMIYRVQEGADILPPRIGRIYKMFIAAAPIHPSIRDHVEDKLNMVWIPCSERLPEQEAGFCQEIFLAYEDISDALYIASVMTPEITHWMPIPHPEEKS